MKRKLVMISFILMLFGLSRLFAQLGEAPIKVFGYFQNEFEYQKGTGDIEDLEENSFALQQLNLFFQKDLGQDWTALINFEIINSFSSLYQRGGFKLEEAWARYRASRQFNLKLGLQIPIFNNLNEIKNRIVNLKKSKKYLPVLEKLIVDAGTVLGGGVLEVVLNKNDSTLPLKLDKLEKEISKRSGVDTQLKFSEQKNKAVGVIVKTIDDQIFVLTDQLTDIQHNSTSPM